MHFDPFFKQYLENRTVCLWFSNGIWTPDKCLTGLLSQSPYFGCLWYSSVRFLDACCISMKKLFKIVSELCHSFIQFCCTIKIQKLSTFNLISFLVPRHWRESLRNRAPVNEPGESPHRSCTKERLLDSPGKKYKTKLC